MLKISRGVTPRRQPRAIFVKKFTGGSWPDREGDEGTRADKDGDACTGTVTGEAATEREVVLVSLGSPSRFEHDRSSPGVLPNAAIPDTRTLQSRIPTHSPRILRIHFPPHPMPSRLHAVVTSPPPWRHQCPESLLCLATSAPFCV